MHWYAGAAEDRKCLGTGNRPKGVTEAATDTDGLDFTEGGEGALNLRQIDSPPEYLYDANGNMTRDENKGT